MAAKSSGLKEKKLDSEELGERIMSDVLRGVFGPGEWLKQIDLERRYNCTRVKVRDALSYLHSKRLVEHIANRGYRVTLPHPERLKEITSIRISLEQLAAKDMVAKATAQDIALARELAEDFKRAAYHGTCFDQIETNFAFHTHLYDLSPNQTLRELIQEMRRRGPAAPVSQWQTVAQLELATKQHFEIVDAVEARDLDLLCERIDLHISGRTNLLNMDINELTS